MTYFDNIAQNYDHVRGTEIWPSLLGTVTSLNNTGQTLLDVATGTGLFSVPLAEHGFCVIGVDCNPSMLTRAIRKARQRRCCFRGALGSAENIPLAQKSISTMLSTNAIHHFNLQAHFREVKRVLRPGGCYVIYTRFRDQNARSIWGQLFPKFAEKEDRLCKPEDFERIDNEFPALALETLDEIAFEKPFSRECLLQDARVRNYSTFALYDEQELEQAYGTFCARLAEWREHHYVSEIGRIIFRRR